MFFWKKDQKIQKKEKMKKRIVKEKGNLFNNAGDLEEHYKLERAKIGEYLKELERDKIRGRLQIYNDKIVGVRASKIRLDSLHRDLNKQIDRINDRIKEINLNKSKKLNDLEGSGKLVDSLSSLDEEAKKVVKLRKGLIDKEKKLIKEMKKVAKSTGDYTGMSEIEISKLFEAQAQKEHIIAEALHLLSEESRRSFMDRDIVDSINKRTQLEISKLNNQLENLHKSKRKILEKKQLLKISEEKFNENMTSLKKEIANLEKKYKSIAKDLNK